MKRRLVAFGIAGFTVLAVGFVARSDAATRTGSSTRATIPLLRVGQLVTYTTFDPAKSFGNGPSIVNTCEPLLKIDPKTGNAVGNLARSFRQLNQFAWEYDLRRNVRFWDGTEMTAADVAASLNYFRFPGTTTATRFQSIREIKAVGKYKVRVNLRNRDAGWRTKLSWTGQIFSKKFFDEHKSTFGQPGTMTMCTGPWRPVSYNPTTGVEYEAHQRYWGGKPNIDHISVKYFANETSGALAFRAGDIDVWPSITGPRAFASTAGTTLVSGPTFNEGYVGMDVTKPPFNDVHVRRAVAYAVNRADLIVGHGGYAVPVTGFIPPNQLRTIATPAQVTKIINGLPKYPYSIAKAKAELAKSKFPNGFDVTTEAYAGTADDNQALAGQLSKIGINLKVNVVPVGTWVADCFNKKTVPMCYSSLGQADPDPAIYPSRMLGKVNVGSGGLNWAQWAPADVETLVKQGVQTSNKAKRLVTYTKLMRRVATDVPYVPIYLIQGTAAISSKFAFTLFTPSVMFGQQWPLLLKAK